MINVSAGIVRRKDGRILVCRRGPGRNHAHLWEFPGGKWEPGEDAAACLKRELEEELSLPVSDIRELLVQETEGIRFTFLTAFSDAEPVLTEHEEMRFCYPGELTELTFCPADRSIAASLALKDRPIEHFLWDFDGTLADTYPQMVQFLSAACRDLGIMESDGQLLKLLKISLPEAVGILAETHQVRVNSLHAAYERHQAAYDPVTVQPMPGILEAVRMMRGRHYLVTHRDIQVMTTLEAWGIRDHFSGHMLRGDDGFVRKPCPDGILRLMRDQQIDPQTAVMIGDRPLDMQAGNRAGIMTCLLDPENRFPNEPATFHVRNASELVSMLQPEI